MPESGKDVRVTIKKLKNPFENTSLAKGTYREICLLKHVSHDNVISLIDAFTTARSPEDINDV